MIILERKVSGIFTSEQGKSSSVEFQTDLETEYLWEVVSLFVGQPESTLNSVSQLEGFVERESTWE